GHAFESRLGAMARTQDLLVRAPKGSVDMSEILRLEQQAHGGREGGNFNLDGPAIALPQDAVQAFAMAVH
ncbi:MAG: sensor histidine protein kinase, partial [Mesorhizobium sp.]